VDISDNLCTQLQLLLHPTTTTTDNAKSVASKQMLDTAADLLTALRENPTAPTTPTNPTAPQLAATAKAKVAEAAEAAEIEAGTSSAKGGLFGALLRRVGLGGGEGEKGEKEGEGDRDTEDTEDTENGDEDGLEAISEQIQSVTEALSSMISIAENGTTTIRPLNSTLGGQMPSLVPPTGIPYAICYMSYVF
jgi:hypothetical protein